ncbi:MDR family MFS transporter [Lactobacillus hominis]|uniref:Major facilitator superfamily permease n=1 Tax=Lactobacillus hominis DSM 23910 = CRBIP 24.179 TaxID=1423758 RepID=I7L787_9LACO|nr:MFS transporter [Lactobacillus hominis]KRM84856.1 transporter, major facilitator family [Lactobacillus hominis DSM 23910 = CRBIP 24.179]MCT3348069.1 MFS transporter [Lactobacillus hominis]CCI82462.1 Major facilitator superfamily permease [Lactobacillus hominis DSM 23910 = CRBIP 24.179]
MLTKHSQDPIRLIWLFAGSLIINTGISFIWPLTTIYIHNYLHETLTIAGIVLFINSAFTMVGNATGGWLFDRWHPYQTILTGVSIATASTLLLVFFHGWPAYPILLVTLGLGNGMVVTGLNSIATLIKSKNASYVFNVLYFTQNLGLVFGSLMVGFILPYGITYIFLLAFIMFAFFNIVVLFEYRGLNKAHEGKRQKSFNSEDTHKPLQGSTQAIAAILFCVFAAWIAYEQWNSNISSYMLSLHMSVRSYSLLWTLNAILIVTLQPFLTHFDDWLTEHLHGRLYIGFSLFGLAFLVLIGAKHYALFALSMATLTIGEILSFPAVSTFVNDRASDKDKGKYQGIVQSITSAGRAFGPLIGALIIDHSSYLILFIFCSSIVIFSVVCFAFINKINKSKKVDPN